MQALGAALRLAAYPARCLLGGCLPPVPARLPAPHHPHPPCLAEGTVFLLPLLLQVTDPAYGAGSEAQARRERELWLDALAAPRVLRELSRYTLACAASCAPAVTTAVAAAADDALLYACQVLLNVLAPVEEHGTAWGCEGSAGEAAVARAQHRRALLEAGEPLPLLRGLLHLAAMRPLLAPHDCSPVEVLTAARWGPAAPAAQMVLCRRWCCLHRGWSLPAMSH